MTFKDFGVRFYVYLRWSKNTLDRPDVTYLSVLAQVVIHNTNSLLDLSDFAQKAWAAFFNALHGDIILAYTYSQSYLEPINSRCLSLQNNQAHTIHNLVFVVFIYVPDVCHPSSNDGAIRFIQTGSVWPSR